MKSLLSVLLFSCLLGQLSGFKVVVVMVENRSFDHLFGYSSLPVNGLKGKNYTNPLGKETFGITKNIPNVVPCDPCHSTDCTTSKIFGYDNWKKGNLTDPTMSGFIETEFHRAASNNATLKNDYCDVMSCYTEDKLPVMNFLAQEYALFDHYFCSHPGPTWPNRMYAIAATTAGSTETFVDYLGKPGLLFPQKTIFEQMMESKKSTKYYYVTTPWELFMRGVIHNPEILADFSVFLDDCQKGTLPEYSWINPGSGVDFDMGLGSNDMHPDHDVAMTERFIKKIYEAVRAGPDWNETVLLITWDEHGGYYDHVVPPHEGVPAPDDSKSYPNKNFKFDRLGVRVPLIAISPLIPKGTVVSRPPLRQKPFNTSQYEHTSIMSTARKLLNVTGFLTKRDEWAATFEHIFSLSKPRDTPLQTPPAPPVTQSFEEEALAPVNDLQLDIARAHGHHAHIAKQGDLHGVLKRRYKAILNKVLVHDYRLGMEDGKSNTTRIVERSWLYDIKKGTIYSEKLNFLGTKYCLTWDQASGNVSVALCRAASNFQTFDWHSDGTVVSRSSGNCLTVQSDIGDSTTLGFRTLSMTPCNGAVFQHFSYYGSKFPDLPSKWIPGFTSGDGYIDWGDGTTSLHLLEKN